MCGNVSLAPANDRHDADRLIRFAVLSRIEIFHILLEHLYDSQRKTTRTRAQLADFIGDSQSREAKICSVRSDCSSGGLPSSDRLDTSSRRIGAASRGSGDRGKVHPRDGHKAVSQVPC
jgi:hypothetical protein